MKSKSSEESLDSVSYTKYLSKTLILDTNGQLMSDSISRKFHFFLAELFFPLLIDFNTLTFNILLQLYVTCMMYFYR